MIIQQLLSTALSAKIITNSSNRRKQHRRSQVAVSTHLSLSEPWHCTSILNINTTITIKDHAPEEIEANCHIRLSHLKNSFKTFVW